jgi:copper homeostasis protein
VGEGFTIEVCLDSADSAVAAQQGGAQRVELCDNLIEGGTTPSAGMISATRRAIDIGMMVMIRPRGGDFCYGSTELEAMLEDIDVAKARGAEGVVFGCLTPEGEIDVEASGRLLERARPMSVTFHRAFDMTRDPHAALESLVRLGVDRVLTSGQEDSVLEGVELIGDLIRRARDRIVVMPGCGITARNIERIARETGAKELHVVATERLVSPMQYRNERVYMGVQMHSPEYSRAVTSASRLRALIEASRA